MYVGIGTSRSSVSSATEANFAHVWEVEENIEPISFSQTAHQSCFNGRFHSRLKSSYRFTNRLVIVKLLRTWITYRWLVKPSMSEIVKNICTVKTVELTSLVSQKSDQFRISYSHYEKIIFWSELIFGVMTFFVRNNDLFFMVISWYCGLNSHFKIVLKVWLRTDDSYKKPPVSLGLTPPLKWSGYRIILYPVLVYSRAHFIINKYVSTSHFVVSLHSFSPSIKS